MTPLRRLLLHPATLHAWLVQQPPGTSIGQAGMAGSCPLSRFLHAAGFGAVWITLETSSGACEEGRLSTYNPAWVVDFLAAVDARPRGEEVTAAEALALLQGVEVRHDEPRLIHPAGCVKSPNSRWANGPVWPAPANGGSRPVPSTRRCCGRWPRPTNLTRSSPDCTRPATLCCASRPSPAVCARRGTACAASASWRPRAITGPGCAAPSSTTPWSAWATATSNGGWSPSSTTPSVAAFITGRIDGYDPERGTLHDYKTTRRLPSRVSEHHRRQVELYAWLLMRNGFDLPTAIRILYISMARVKGFDVPVPSPDQLDALETELLDQIRRLLHAEPPEPVPREKWECKYCAFTQCPSHSSHEQLEAST